MKLARKLLLAAAISSCSSTVLVEVSPRMVLDREKTIGIVAFDVQGSESGAPDVTSRFVEALQEGQPGIPVIELGSSAEVLAAAGRTRLDAEALRAIGEKFDVDRVIVGTLTLQESKPKVDVSLGQVFESGSLHAQVRLDGSLDAKLFDTERGGDALDRLELALDRARVHERQHGGVRLDRRRRPRASNRPARLRHGAGDELRLPADLGAAAPRPDVSGAAELDGALDIAADSRGAPPLVGTFAYCRPP
jgi:hypothetical protein